MPAMPHHFLGAIGTWWQSLHKSCATADNAETPQLRTLAGKWPDSADLMSQRLAALQLNDGANIERDGDCQHTA